MVEAGRAGARPWRGGRADCRCRFLSGRRRVPAKAVAGRPTIRTTSRTLRDDPEPSVAWSSLPGSRRRLDGASRSSGRRSPAVRRYSRCTSTPCRWSARSEGSPRRGSEASPSRRIGGSRTTPTRTRSLARRHRHDNVLFFGHGSARPRAGPSTMTTSTPSRSTRARVARRRTVQTAIVEARHPAPHERWRRSRTTSGRRCPGSRPRGPPRSTSDRVSPRSTTPASRAALPGLRPAMGAWKEEMTPRWRLSPRASRSAAYVAGLGNVLRVPRRGTRSPAAATTSGRGAARPAPRAPRSAHSGRPGGRRTSAPGSRRAGSPARRRLRPGHRTPRRRRPAAGAHPGARRPCSRSSDGGRHDGRAPAAVVAR